MNDITFNLSRTSFENSIKAIEELIEPYPNDTPQFDVSIQDCL